MNNIKERKEIPREYKQAEEIQENSRRKCIKEEENRIKKVKQQKENKQAVRI